MNMVILSNDERNSAFYLMLNTSDVFRTLGILQKRHNNNLRLKKLKTLKQLQENVMEVRRMAFFCVTDEKKAQAVI